MLKMEAESGSKQKLGTIFAGKMHTLLREAKTEQIRKAQRASTVVQNYADSDACVAQWLCTLLREKFLSPIFLNGSFFLQSDITKKKTAAKTSLSQSVSTAMKALLFFTVLAMWKAAREIAVCMRHCIGKREVGFEWPFRLRRGPRLLPRSSLA